MGKGITNWEYYHLRYNTGNMLLYIHTYIFLGNPLTLFFGIVWSIFYLHSFSFHSMFNKCLMCILSLLVLYSFFICSLFILCSLWVNLVFIQCFCVGSVSIHIQISLEPTSYPCCSPFHK